MSSSFNPYSAGNSNRDSDGFNFNRSRTISIEKKRRPNVAPKQQNSLRIQLIKTDFQQFFFHPGYDSSKDVMVCLENHQMPYLDDKAVDFKSYKLVKSLDQPLRCETLEKMENSRRNAIVGGETVIEEGDLD
jgi:hypothetical protein